MTVKPLVKHVLSKELQLYFGKICSALLDDSNDEYRVAALASIRSDPGLHQLVPYFVQFISEKVTHNLKNLFILTQIVQLTSAMLDNESLYVDPYVCTFLPLPLPLIITDFLDRSRPLSPQSSPAWLVGILGLQPTHWPTIPFATLLPLFSARSVRSTPNRLIHSAHASRAPVSNTCLTLIKLSGSTTAVSLACKQPAARKSFESLSCRT